MKKRILFIGTGGTIASEMSDEGLLPGVGASALLGYVPDVAELCEAESVQLFELDSTNIPARTGGWRWRAPCAETTRASTASSSATARTRWPTPPPR